MLLLGLVLGGALESWDSKHENLSGYLAKITCAAVKELIQVESLSSKVHVELESAERRLYHQIYRRGGLKEQTCSELIRDNP